MSLFSVGIPAGLNAFLIHPGTVMDIIHKVNFQPRLTYRLSTDLNAESDDEIYRRWCRESDEHPRYASIFHVAHAIIHEDGFSGLMRGAFDSAFLHFLQPIVAQGLMRYLASKRLLGLSEDRDTIEFSELLVRACCVGITRTMFQQSTALVTRLIAQPSARKEIQGADALTAMRLEKEAHEVRLHGLEFLVGLCESLAGQLSIIALVRLFRDPAGREFGGWRAQIVEIPLGLAGAGIMQLLHLALDTVSKRLQVQSTSVAEDGIVRLRPELYRGPIHAIFTIAHEEGWSALVRSWRWHFFNVFARAMTDILEAWTSAEFQLDATLSTTAAAQPAGGETSLGQIEGWI